MRERSFGEVVSLIVQANELGREACRAYFSDPTGFKPDTDKHNGIKRVLLSTYKRLWELTE